MREVDNTGKISIHNSNNDSSNEGDYNYMYRSSDNSDSNNDDNSKLAQRNKLLNKEKITTTLTQNIHDKDMAVSALLGSDYMPGYILESLLQNPPPYGHTPLYPDNGRYSLSRLSSFSSSSSLQKLQSQVRRCYYC